VLPFYIPNDENDKTLVFESRFESGNLAMAFRLSDQEYNLVLQNDINTKGHT
jgi:cytosolic carboxypeptidase protein 2/3